MVDYCHFFFSRGENNNTIILLPLGKVQFGLKMNIMRNFIYIIN